MEKQRKNRLSVKQVGYDYFTYVCNDQLMTWAMDKVLRDYIHTIDENRDDQLKKKCRYFIEAINQWPTMQEYNLGLFQQDIDELYNDFKHRIQEELDLKSYGFSD